MEEWPTSSEFIYKMMYKTPTFAEPQQYNIPFSWRHVQLSSINTANGMWLLRSDWKKKKSCNKNANKNTEMLENYIYCIPINCLTSQYFYSIFITTFLLFFIHCRVATCHLPYLLMKADTWRQGKGLLYCWGSAKIGVLYIIL